MSIQNIKNNKLILLSYVLKFILILFVPNALWHQRFILFGLFFVLCSIEEKLLKNATKKFDFYASISVTCFIIAMFLLIVM